MENKRLSKEKRRKQIKDVALELFVNKGYAKAECIIILQVKKKFFWNFYKMEVNIGKILYWSI